MARVQEPVVGVKRGPGRPAKHDTPAAKKAKIATTASSHLTTSLQSPAEASPTPEKKAVGLPIKVSDHRPLPTLSEPQSVSLSASEYQTIAASAVLQTSLDRSRLKWVGEGIFERYWVKPESGKNARPAPPNNPELKWQKHKGPCRIRIEPHIFEAEIYVEEKAQPQVKQYVPPPQSPYGQPYRPGQAQQPYGHGQQQQHPQYYQNRTLPPIQQQNQNSQVQQQNTLPPIKNISQAPAPPQAQPPRAQAQSPPQPQPQQQDKKATADPVISMLATRASGNPELKALMREVAEGKATQDQLKIFQGHIDELTQIIKDKKKKEEEEEAAKKAAKPTSQQTEVIQYDGAADGMPPQAAQPSHQQPIQQRPYQPPAPPYQHQPPIQQQTWVPPPPPQPPAPPPSQPVILAFTTPGSTEDRFLFPQHTILESLSPQHLLASFIVKRKGSQAVDPRGLDPQTEYWQPVTLMVEVAYNREFIVECVKRWVKPAEEVRKHMEEVMGRCTRAPEGYLALRLPVKGSAMAETEDVALEEISMATFVEDKAAKKGPNIKYVKKATKLESIKIEGGKDKQEPSAPTDAKNVAAGDANTAARPNATAATGETAAQPEQNAVSTDANRTDADANAEAQATGETGRPRRATRKSVRISEG